MTQGSGVQTKNFQKYSKRIRMDNYCHIPEFVYYIKIICLQNIEFVKYLGFSTIGICYFSCLLVFDALPRSTLFGFLNFFLFELHCDYFFTRLAQIQNFNPGIYNEFFGTNREVTSRKYIFGFIHDILVN